MMKRTHTCGALRTSDEGNNATINGWVKSYRDHGGILFIDIRDYAGITQVVFDPDKGQDMYDIATKLRLEDVVAVTGTVVLRTGGINPKLPTGEVEVLATSLELLNKAEAPPILPDDQAGAASEDKRLQYRYLDLRSNKMQNILRTRHNVTQLMRNYLSDQGFIEIETPFLCKSTPEGARDFLVPSRLQAGAFYALPQSPQLFKQILMAAGCDKYMQIARCFRDEDPRADRQAEFTQLDIELSFVDSDDVMKLTEGLWRAIWKEILDVEITEFPVITYHEAMNRFGIDRPDCRFGMELVDLTELAGQCDFRVFSQAIEDGGVVKAICVPGGASMSRKQTDALAKWVQQQFGAGGLPTVKVTEDGLATGIAKFLSPIADSLVEQMDANVGDLICFASDSFKRASQVLGELRIRLAKDLDMIEPNQWKFLWVVDFPLLDWNEDEKRWDSPHHPFTAPMADQMDILESDTGAVLSQAYDLVLNGSEVSGGSIRNHQPEVQKRIFSLLGISEEEAKIKFSFLLDALKFGCPPHGGIAVGLDRMIMQLVGTENIRDVIAFPKTLTGMDLMTEAPSLVDQTQLEDLHINVIEDPQKEG